MKQQISTNRMNGIYCFGTLSSMNVDVLFTIDDIIDLMLPEKIGFSMRFTNGMQNFVATNVLNSDKDKQVNVYVF